ncbi:MAG: hypothetical protein Q9180_009714, partial [Flavoplaca navasiana]
MSPTGGFSPSPLWVNRVLATYATSSYHPDSSGFVIQYFNKHTTKITAICDRSFASSGTILLVDAYVTRLVRIALVGFHLCIRDDGAKRVEQAAASGPSLMKPMGAVDAVGSNLVQRIGKLGVKGEAAAPARGSVRD